MGWWVRKGGGGREEVKVSSSVLGLFVANDQCHVLVHVVYRVRHNIGMVWSFFVFFFNGEKIECLGTELSTCCYHKYNITCTHKRLS